MKPDITVSVDKRQFLEVARVFKRAYRPSGSRFVTITLEGGYLEIDFDGGGSRLTCGSSHSLAIKLTGHGFAGIAAAYRTERDLSGSIELTFRPEHGEFATPLAGARASFL